MTAIQLTPAQRKEHRAAAHHLNPVVMIGGEGLTPAVVKEVDAALTAHELIKVRVFSDQRNERDAMLIQLASEVGAAAIQHIGKLLVLWRPAPDKAPVVKDDRAPGPRVVKILKFSKSGSQRAQVKRVTILGNERLTPGGIVKRAKKRIVSTKRRSQGD